MDVANSCRLCGALVDPGDAVSLIEPHNEVYAAWLAENLRLQIHKDNKFPDKICNSCLQDINMWDQFKGRCQKAHEIFTEQIKSQNLETDSTITEPQIVDEECDRRNVESLSTNQQGQESDVYKNMHLKELTVSISKLTDKQIDKYISKTSVQETANCEQELFLSSDQMKSGEIVGSTLSNTQILTCNFCNKCFVRKSNLWSHICKHLSIQNTSKNTKTKHRIKKFQCKFCKSKFVDEYKLFIHEKKCKGYNIRPFVCKTCKCVSYKTSLELEKHMKIHEIDREVICDYCGVTCKNEAERLKHVSTRHGMLHHCMFCTYTSGDNRKVNTHNEMHLNNDYELKLSKRNSKFPCVYCKQDFDNKEDRNNHSNVEHGQLLPYLCEICGIRFFPFDLYKHHTRIRHSGHHFIYCQFCPKEFRTKFYLWRHVNKIHPKEKINN